MSMLFGTVYQGLLSVKLNDIPWNDSVVVLDRQSGHGIAMPSSIATLSPTDALEEFDNDSSPTAKAPLRFRSKETDTIPTTWSGYYDAVRIEKVDGGATLSVVNKPKTDWLLSEHQGKYDSLAELGVLKQVDGTPSSGSKSFLERLMQKAQRVTDHDPRSEKADNTLNADDDFDIVSVPAEVETLDPDQEEGEEQDVDFHTKAQGSLGRSGLDSPN